MKKKINVGILFGGKSAEHEVSLQSAKNVIEAVDKDKYNIYLIGIDKSGQWLLLDPTNFLINANDPKLIKLNDENHKKVALLPQSEGQLIDLSGESLDITLDVVFPVLHGPLGEDGTVQGLLKLAGVPFVGASVLGSAVGMDKDIMKRLLRDSGIPIGKFLAFNEGEILSFEEIVSELGLPLFVKPANLGSSVGVSKVKDRGSFESAVLDAFKYDTKILIEEFIEGRELECAVLGNYHPEASCIGEIVPHQEFYSYDAKYIDENGSSTVVPADIDPIVEAEVKEISLRVFKTLSCEGLGRVDFFLKSDGTIIVNEINTIPGFTKISMYPQLWRASGVSYTELIDRLIELATERFEREEKLQNIN